MCLVALVKGTLEFVEALYHFRYKIAKVISTRNAMYGMFKLETRLDVFRKKVIRDIIFVILKIYIHFSVEKRKNIFSFKAVVKIKPEKKIQA